MRGPHLSEFLICFLQLRQLRWDLAENTSSEAGFLKFSSHQHTRVVPGPVCLLPSSDNKEGHPDPECSGWDLLWRLFMKALWSMKSTRTTLKGWWPQRHWILQGFSCRTLPYGPHSGKWAKDSYTFQIKTLWRLKHLPMFWNCSGPHQSRWSEKQHLNSTCYQEVEPHLWWE